MPIPALCLGAALVVGLTPVRPATAFELFGLSFFSSESSDADDAEMIGEPATFEARLEMLDQPGDDQIDRTTVLAASRVLSQLDEQPISLPGLLAEARADYRRLLGALYTEGRYGGDVLITANGREISALPADVELAEPIALVVAVDPGPIYRFDTLDIVGPAPETSDRRDQVPRFGDLGFVPGAFASSVAIRQAEAAIVEGWRQQGYALAQAIQRSVIADHASRTVDVTIGAIPGQRARLGAVRVEGTERMDAAFVGYMTGLMPGEVYDPDDIDAAQERLASLEVFRSVRVETGERIQADGTLPVTVIVQERPLRRIGVGATYASTEGLGLEAFWLHRNLFGRAERLRVEGQINGIDGVDADDFSYRLGASLRVPGLMTPDTVGTAHVAAERTVLDAYTQTGASAALGLEHPFSPYLTGRLSLEGRHAEFRDDVFGERNFTSAGFRAGMTYDTRDDMADATEGLYLDAALDPFFEFSRAEPGVAATAEARVYQSLSGEDRLVVAARLRIGTLVGPSIADTAPDRLFLAGGGGSVRGYGYRTIGVEQPGGSITGGRSLAEGSIELRARFTDTLGGVVFADAGQVGSDSLIDFDGDVKVGVGAGLRYRTPLGPIRFDVGVPLDPGPDDPNLAFYLGIGQAF